MFFGQHPLHLYVTVGDYIKVQHDANNVNNYTFTLLMSDDY